MKTLADFLTAIEDQGGTWYVDGRGRRWLTSFDGEVIDPPARVLVDEASWGEAMDAFASGDDHGIWGDADEETAAWRDLMSAIAIGIGSRDYRVTEIRLGKSGCTMRPTVAEATADTLVTPVGDEPLDDGPRIWRSNPGS